MSPRFTIIFAPLIPYKFLIANGIFSTISRAITEFSPSFSLAILPDSPWIYAPIDAALKGSIFLPIRDVIIPESTSPEPAVASSGPPVLFIYTLFPSVTMVLFPFSNRVVLYFLKNLLLFLVYLSLFLLWIV